MNARQVKKNLTSDTIAILVFGACENHGDHMPFGSDFIFPIRKKIIDLSEEFQKKEYHYTPGCPIWR